MLTLTLTRPDDCHLHLRDGEALRAVLPDTARRFARAIVMPNLKPPVTTVEQAASYRQRILEALPDHAEKTKGRTEFSCPLRGETSEASFSGWAQFEPLMTLYLTDNTSPAEIDRAKDSGFVHAVKLYPAGATTNSDAGITNLTKCRGALARMEKRGIPLLVHGEVTDPAVDIFDREAVFIEQVLMPLLSDFPSLNIVLEHVTTKEGIDFVRESGPTVAATLTAHHLLINRNALFNGGLRPHHYCLPVAKREVHRQALVKAAISGNPKFFLGTDSAPHGKTAKESACGCAGCYTAAAGIELYAEVFDAAGALDRLDDFASRFGAAFYNLPRNAGNISLIRESWLPPLVLPYAGNDSLVPWRAGENVKWRLIDE